MDCWCTSHSIYRTIGQMPILITVYYDSIIHFFLVFAKWKSHYSFCNLVTFLWPLKPIHAHHPVPWSSDFCSYVCWMKLGKRMWKCPTKSETILQFAKLNFFQKNYLFYIPTTVPLPSSLHIPCFLPTTIYSSDLVRN